MFIASLIESPFLDTRMWQKRKTQLANKERLSYRGYTLIRV